MKLTGIIDIGSNSMRLSITAQLENGGYYVVDEQKATPRLANYVHDRRLSPEGINQLLFHLREFQGICHAFGVEEVAAIGTAALRSAENQQDIIDRVKRETGFVIDVISGADEALLGVSAVKHTLDVTDAYLVDIGGASTEVTLLEDGRIAASHSFPFGAVTLSKMPEHAFVEHGTLRVPGFIAESLASVPFLQKRPAIEMIGIGGTIRNIARVHQAHTAYPLVITHNYTMRISDVWQIVRWLSTLPLARRKKAEGLSKERADVIVQGGVILLSLLETLQSSVLRISGRGLRDGAFYTRILRKPYGPAPLQTVLQSSVQNTLRRFQTPEDHAAHVTRLAFDLYRAAVSFQLLPPFLDRIVYAAAMLHRIGIQVSYYNYDLHTFYLIFSSSIHGLSHKEIILTAAIASYKGRRRMRQLCQPYQSLLSDEDLAVAAKLGTIVRIAESLDRRHEKRVSGVQLKINDDRFDIWLPKGADAEVEIAAASTWAAHVKKTFGRTLSIGV